MAAKRASSSKTKKKAPAKKTVKVEEQFAYGCAKCENANTNDFDEIKKHDCTKKPKPKSRSRNVVRAGKESTVKISIDVYEKNEDAHEGRCGEGNDCEYNSENADDVCDESNNFYVDANVTITGDAIDDIKMQLRIRKDSVDCLGGEYDLMLSESFCTELSAQALTLWKNFMGEDNKEKLRQIDTYKRGLEKLMADPEVKAIIAKEKKK